MKIMIPEKTMVLCIGIQASGKSSFCRETFPALIHVSLDDLHTRKKEEALIDDCLKRGVSLVIDNTNPTKESREGYISKAKENGYKVYGFYFRSSVEECIRRNDEREGKAQVPRIAIAHTHRILEVPAQTEGFDRLFYVCIAGEQFLIDDWKEEVANEV